MRLELEPRATAFPLVENGISEDAFASVSWDFESLLKKGIAAAQGGDRDHARKLLSQATAINPVSEDAWMWLASISDYPEELLAFLNRVLEINPENDKATEWRSATTSLLAKTFVQRALAARNDGSLEHAEQCLDQALAHDADCESAWFWKASLAKSDDEKLEFFARVLTINPENTDASDAVDRIKYAQTEALFDEARAFAAAGDRDKAVEILGELTLHESAEFCESAWLAMAELAETDDQRVEFLYQALEVNPENQQASHAVAAIMRSRSQAAFDEAKAAAAAGDRQKAVDILDDFVKDVPDSVDAWLLKSHLSVSLEEKVEALERAQEIDPENAAARSGLSFLSLTFGAAPEQKEEQKAEVVEEVAVEEEAVFEPVEADHKAPTVWMESVVPAAEPELFADDSVEESMPTNQLDAVEFAYRQTEETYTVEEPETAIEISPFVESMKFETETTQPAEAIVHEREYADSFDLSTRPEPASSFEQLFGPIADESDPSTQTVDSFAPFTQESVNQDPFAAEAPVSQFDRMFEPVLAAEPEVEEAAEEEVPFHAEVPFQFEEAAPATKSCPFCSSPNDVQAFECSTCNATMTLSDLEKLLSGTTANKEMLQHAVTAMEGEWNTREFSESELTALGIGHFNLGNTENGFKYLQEASRLNPNNVILSGQVNTVAIRLEEMRRQTESHVSMPKGKKILVVDDSPTVRKLIAGKLEKSGHNVVCAVDGVDALAKMEEGMPDLVLLDITMPRMDGYEVCKQIRANPEGKNLPVVMISGKDGFFDKVRGRMAGTSGYVTKPFGPETLMKALETYLLPDEVEVS